MIRLEKLLFSDKRWNGCKEQEVSLLWKLLKTKKKIQKHRSSEIIDREIVSIQKQVIYLENDS